MPADSDEEVVRLSVVSAADPTTVWSCFADPARLAEWFANVSLELAPGGRFRERWRGARGRMIVTAGTVVAVEHGRGLRLTWADEGWDFETEVEVTLAARGEGTEIGLLHSGWEGAPAEKRAALVHAHRGGWQSHLADLAQYAASLKDTNASRG
jgi:uncharacterized protein YndB with AHSA1/START domain